MPQYEIEVGGRRFQIEAPSPEAATAAAQKFAAPPAEKPDGYSARTYSEEHPFQYAADTLWNVIPSAAKAAKDTALGVVSLGRQIQQFPGQMVDMTREKMAGNEGTVPDLSRTVGNIVPGVLSNLSDRWGTSEARAENIKADPTGMALDGLGVISAISGLRQGVGKLSQAAGKQVYKGGVALSNPTLKREFGVKELANRGFDEEIALGARGAQKAEKLGLASADQADALIAQRAAAAPVIPPRGPGNPGATPGFVSLGEAQQGVPQLHAKAQASALGTREPALQQIDSLANEMKQGHHWPVSLPEAQAMKRAEQEVAHQLYRVQDRGGHVPAMDKTRAQFGRSTANDLQRAIEQNVPEVAGINSRTQDLLGLQRLAERASEQSHIVGRGITAGTAAAAVSPTSLPGAAATAALTMALTSPGGLSRLGLLLKQGGKYPLTGAPMASTPSRLTLIGDLAARLRPEEQ